MVFTHAVVGFHVSDHGFDSGAAFQLCLQAGFEGLSARDEDLPRWTCGQPGCWIRCFQFLFMSPISLINVGAFRSDAGQGRRLFQGLAQRVAVKRVTVQSIGMKDEHSTLGTAIGASDCGLAAELIRRTRLALSYALHLWCIPGIDLWFGVSVQGLPRDNARLS